MLGFEASSPGGNMSDTENLVKKPGPGRGPTTATF